MKKTGKGIGQMLVTMIALCWCMTAHLQLYAQSSKPNIIYILADDMGYGDVSSLNTDSKLHTAHIDQLSENGMRFTDAHSGSALCTPTRYGILTGRYAWRTRLQNGVLWSYDSALINKERVTVASMLKSKGYQTACIGKWHLGLDWQKDAKENIALAKPILNGPTTLGFDYFFGITASLDIPPYVYIENNRITATSIDTIDGTTGKGFWRKGPVGNDFKHNEVLQTFTQKAVAYIEKASHNSSPFFLYFPLSAPHTPILPSEKFLGKSGTNVYGDFVLMVDDVVGQITEAVHKAGIEKNTLIVFTSDNGCSPMADFKELATFGHYPSYLFRGEKSDIFEGGHRIPFIVQWPVAVSKGTVCNTTVCLTDLLATCADILKTSLPVDAAPDSYSVLPLLTQQGKYLRTATVHHSGDGNFSIRQGDWKLEFCAGSGGWSSPTKKELETMHLPPMQLYNVKDDIGETKNLYAQYPGKVKQLTDLMQSIIANGRSTAGSKLSNDVTVKLIK